MILTIGGRPGAWKSTIAKLLAEHLGYEVISIGAIKRKLAQEMGITISEFNQMGHDNPEFQHEHDLKYETYQQNLPLESKIILESRLGFYNQPDGFNVYLTLDRHIAAQRIFEHQREEDASESLEHVYETTQQRDREDRDAYIEFYGVDMGDMTKYDLVVDTGELTPEQVTEKILEAFSLFLKTQWLDTKQLNTK